MTLVIEHPRSGEGASVPAPSKIPTVVKLAVSAALLLSAVSTVTGNADVSVDEVSGESVASATHRRLSSASVGSAKPKYLDGLFKDLKARKKLFEDTPKEEIKYWFEYAGPLQKYFYRFSKSRGKADYFEGRDDSGVTSARFIEVTGGSAEHSNFFQQHSFSDDQERSTHLRLLENCLSMGSPSRPKTDSGLWKDWFGSQASPGESSDRCRVLFTINTVGAGRGTTLLWETNPPQKHAQGPPAWTSEQETAATHLQRNLEEIDTMCASGQIAARVQMLVCEPISARWTEWMDSMLPHCGGKLSDLDKISERETHVEERPSPVQVVVVASANTADTCHDLKSGFMEKRVQDLIIAPPFLGDGSQTKSKTDNPAVKTTHPDLVSSDDHDLYVALKWTSLITLRGVHSFLQASADLAAAASSPKNQGAPTPEKNADGVTVALSNSPSSPFLIPSFVRVSYVSEENSKVAKWRMHGDFFHPAAWEICKDSYDVTWIDHSLSGSNGVSGICYSDNSVSDAMARKLKEFGGDCGQWWVYMTELQMPTSPDVYANEITPPLVQGGSNYIWMVTERQRREIVKRQVCLHNAGDDKAAIAKCPLPPQAVMPLGDLESFLINFTPNTALGKKHVKDRRPGYSHAKEHEDDREKVRERKQLKGQEDIEKALFDYTIYPAALFRKDATIKAARARDIMLTPKALEARVGPQTIKSSYYDVTITKPRPPVLGWCQAIARGGLCTLYADYFRTSDDIRCLEACGLKKNWAKIDEKSE